MATGDDNLSGTGDSPTRLESAPEWYRKPTLVLGCGNRLLGDDGFGPELVDHVIASREVPDSVCLMDAGTSSREILFNLLVGDSSVRRLIIIDAVDFSDKGRSPGDVFEIGLDEIPPKKIDDFSMHQVPSSNMLHELRDAKGMEIIVLACQAQEIPEEVSVGLSGPLRAALPIMADLLQEYW